MRSKNLSCKLHWSLIRKDLTRFWPVWGSYLAIWLLILPIPMLTSYSGTEAYSDMIRSIHRLLTGTGDEAALVMTAIYGGLSAFAVWSYLYQSRSASLFHALPVTRETLFCSHFTAGLSFLLAPNVLIALLTYLCQMSLGYFDPTQILCWLAVVCLESLLFYALGTLAAMCTGNLPAMPVLYGLINFAVVVYESLLTEFSTQLYWGVSSQPLKLTFLSPFIQLAQTSCYVNESTPVTLDGVYTTWETIRFYSPDFLVMLCLYALAAVALVFCSLLLYRRRTTESAGDVIAFDFLKPIAKYCFAFGCALVLGWIFDEVIFYGTDNALPKILCCCLGGAIGYIAAVMLLKKSFRVFQFKKMAGLLVLWAVICGLFMAFEADLFGVESHVPRLGELTEATLYSDYDLQLTQPQDMDKVLELHRAILDNKDALEDYERYNSVPYDGGYCYVRINYYYEDGTTLRRSYNLPCGEQELADPASPAYKLSAIMSDPQRLVDNHLPPKDAVIESIQLNLYGDQIRLAAGEPFALNYSNHCYVDSAHTSLLLNALEEDIRARRLCVWNERNQPKHFDHLFTVEFNYDRPAAHHLSQTVTVLENAEIYHSTTQAVDYETIMASEWKSVEVYSFDDPKSTMNLLVQLGYLTSIPSVLDGEVPNG